MLFTLTMIEMHLIYRYNPGTCLGLIAALKDAENDLPVELEEWHDDVLALIDRLSNMSDETFIKQTLHNLKIDDINE